MMQESFINSPLLAGLAITLIHFLWQGVLVALVLKALLSLISGKKPQLRYALSSLAMVANLVLPAITFFIVYDIEYRQATSFVHALPLLDQNFYLENIQTDVWYMEWLEYLPSLAIVWLAIVAALALKLIIELYNVNKLPLQGATAVDAALLSRFDALRVEIGLSRHVALLMSCKTDVPMAIGWLKPVVLIPFSMLSGLSPQQLDMLLLHELAHIRRHDYLVNFFQTLVEILLFFHPAVNWVSKQMRNEREYCSDDIAVHHCGSSLAYAHTLADTASLCEKHRKHTIPNMAMAASGGDLKQRVVRLLDQQQHCSTTSDSGKWLASFSLLLTIIFLFSTHALTLPIIDLQSGSISIQKSAKELNKSAIDHIPFTFEQLGSQAALASQLLAIDDNDAPAQAESVNLHQAASNNNVKSIETTSLHNTNALSKSLTPPNYNELPIVRDNSAFKSNTTQQQVALKSDSQISKNLNTVNVKSMSELAFERTKPKPTSDKEQQYSQQLASLRHDVKLPRETQITALNRTHYNSREQHQNYNNSALNRAPFSQGKLSNTVIEYKGLPANNMAAQLLNSVEPKYPSSAKRKGIELEIMVEFNIGRDGLVKDIQFESKSKASYFRKSIRNAMKNWRFLPAKENGRAVESKMSKIFSFSLLE